MRFSYAIVALVSLASALPTQGPIEDRSPCVSDDCYHAVRAVVLEERKKHKNKNKTAAAAAAAAAGGARRSVNLFEIDTRDISGSDVEGADKRDVSHPGVDLQARADGLRLEERKKKKKNKNKTAAAAAAAAAAGTAKRSSNLFDVVEPREAVTGVTSDLSLKERADGFQLVERKKKNKKNKTAAAAAAAGTAKRSVNLLDARAEGEADE